MLNWLDSRKNFEAFQRKVSEFPQPSPTKVLHFKPSYSKVQVSISSSHIFAHFFKMHVPSDYYRCSDTPLFFLSFFLLLSIIGRHSDILFVFRSGIALSHGLFPICQKGAKSLFGIGTGLIHSCLETPNAPTHPHPFRRGVPGNSTCKGQDPQTAPLDCKADTVQRCVQPSHLCLKKKVELYFVSFLTPPQDGCMAS